MMILILELMLLFPLTFAASSTAVAPTEERCVELLRSTDTCVNKILIITDPDVDQFKTRAQFKRDYCDQVSSWIKCANEYRVCIKSFQRTLFGVIINGLKDAFAKFCNTPQAVTETYKHARCLNPSNRERFLTINDKLVGLADHTASVSDTKAIPTLCCGVHLMLRDTEHLVNGLCKDISAPDSGNFLVSVIKLSIDSFLDLVCATHSSVDKCLAIEGDLTRKLTKMQSNQPVTDRRIMRSLLAVLERLDMEMNEQP